MSDESMGTRPLVRLSLAWAWRSPALWGWGTALTASFHLRRWIFGGFEVPPLIKRPSSFAGTPAASLDAVAQAFSLRQHAIVALQDFLTVWLLVALTRAALTVLQGRSPGVGAVISAVRLKWRSILVFAALFSAGKFLLGLLGTSARGLLLGGLLSSLWTFSLYLGIPVLAREATTGLGAVRRAWALIRQGWARRLAGLFLIGIRYTLFALAVLLVSGVALYFVVDRQSTEAPTWLPLFRVLVEAVFFPAWVLFLVVDQVFDAALYTSLTEGAGPALPSDSEPEATWRARA
jgi:hypothetical protein